MKTIRITALIATSLFCAGSVFAAGGQGRRGNGDGSPPESGQNRGACQQDCPNGNDGTCDKDCDRVRQGKGNGNGNKNGNGKGRGQGNGKGARDGSGPRGGRN